MKLSTIMFATLGLTAAMNASALTQGNAKLISHHVSSTNPALVLKLIDAAIDKKESNGLALSKIRRLSDNDEGILVDLSIERDVSTKVNQRTDLLGTTNLYIENHTNETHQYTIKTGYCSLILHNACSNVVDVYELQPNTYFEINKTSNMDTVFEKAGFDKAIFYTLVSRDHSNRDFIAESKQFITVEE
jgi:hypothetical protein